MSGANPVEPKIEAPKPAASALAEPVAAPAVKKRPWSRLRIKQKLFVLACGSGVAIAAGAYGYKYFTASPGAASAQTDTTPAAKPESKSSEPAKLPASVMADELPPVVVPPVKQVKNEEPADGTIHIKAPVDVPAVRPAKPTPGPGDDEVLPIKPPDAVSPRKDKEKEGESVPLILVPTLPGKTKDASKADEPPPLAPPPIPDIDRPDPKKKKPEPDPFKAPAPVPTADKVMDIKVGPSPLPTEVIGKSDRSTDPVLRVGGSDTSPPPLPPAPPTDEIRPPAPPKAGDPPAIQKIDLDIVAPPPGPMPDKKVDKKTEIPTLVVPPIKDAADPPRPPDPGTSGVTLPPPAGKSGTLENKDEYLEDWHTRTDDSPAEISREYYKTPDYAKALEAYNKERRKPGERIIRVPPTWVLEAQFPGLIPRSDRPATSDIKTTGNIKFEPVASTTSPRPSPPAASGNDEYKVAVEAGESIREIARKVYGSPDSWKKLYDLNPNLDPTQPIPSGTTLRLGR